MPSGGRAFIRTRSDPGVTVVAGDAMSNESSRPVAALMHALAGFALLLSGFLLAGVLDPAQVLAQNVVPQRGKIMRPASPVRPPAAPPTVSITEYDTGSGTTPLGITAGPDGA